MRVCAVAVSLYLLIGAALANLNVSIIRQQLAFEEIHVLSVDTAREYILDFVPTGDQGLWPSRVWIKTDGGDTAHPLLITARQRIGATTWQLPFSLGDTLLYQQERTLCPEDSVSGEALKEDCEGPEPTIRGSFSLHIGSSCFTSTALSLRVTPVRDFRLAFEIPLTVYILQGAPSVHYYQFLPEQHSVRVVVESNDEVCATIAIQNYTCPIADTTALIQSSTMRMTVLKSGGTYVSRQSYPSGFYLIARVHENDDECRESTPDADDWLWEAAVLAAAGEHEHDRLTVPQTRDKTLTMHVKVALTRAQYLVGAAVALSVFLLFYVVFGALVLAQRWPRWKRLVAPQAVLARKPGEVTRSEIESTLSTTAARRRRDSDATFDSSDNSDTDDEEVQEEVVTTTTVASVAATAMTPTPMTPSPVTPDTVTPTTVTPTPVTPTALTPTAVISIVPTSTETIGSNPTGPVVTTSTDNHINAEAGAERTFGIDNEVSENGIYVVDENSRQSGRAGVSRQISRPFGLPLQLNVAALARRRARVLQARSDRYLYTLYTVGMFYALPVVQFVAAFQLVMNVSGSLDICYYNFLCAHPAGAISDFNHIFSNVGYLLLGALFMLQVRRRKMRRKRTPRHEEYGIPTHYGLLTSLGAAMMMVALLSATYHVCPNGLNFQFDTAFMYVLAVLSMIKIYQSRHPDVNARAHATFGVLAVLISLVVWGVLGGGPLFWSLFTVLHVFSFLVISLRIYYVGQFRFEKESLQVAARGLRSLPNRGIRPLYTARLVLLLIANALNWMFAIYGLFTQGADFASHLLMVLLANTLMHMMFYLTMKLLHGERLRWYSWLYLAVAAASWAPALYFFVSGSTNWSTTPALSRHLNHECQVLQFYDSHDLWHMLSAVALFFSFNAMLTWDDGLTAVKRTDIAVF